MTAYTLRIVLICPDAMRDDCNDFAMVTGYGPPDGSTFKSSDWQDADGNLYAVAAPVTTPDFPAGASSTLVRPEWDAEPYTVNMAGADRAQAALVIYDPSAPVAPDPSRLLAIILTDTSPTAAHAALDAVSLTRVYAL